MKGLFGRYADVDLTSGTVRDYEIPQEWYHKYLGGNGCESRTTWP